MLVGCFGNAWGPRRDRSPAWACGLIRTRTRAQASNGAPRSQAGGGLVSVGSQPEASLVSHRAERPRRSMRASLLSHTGSHLRPGLLHQAVESAAARSHGASKGPLRWPLKSKRGAARTKSSCPIQRRVAPSPTSGQVTTSSPPSPVKVCQSPVSRSRSLIVRAMTDARMHQW